MRSPTGRHTGGRPLVRKVLADGGEGLAALLEALPATPAARARHAALIDITHQLARAAQADPELPYWVADDYLRAVALVLLEWAWGRIEAAPGGGTPRWKTPAQAFAHWVLPEFDLRAAVMRTRIAATAAAATTDARPVPVSAEKSAAAAGRTSATCS